MLLARSLSSLSAAASTAAATAPRAMGTAASIDVPHGGGGGRSSWAGRTVTVFGSAGFLGSYVVAHLAEVGNTIVAAHRGDEMDVRHLKVMGDYGKVAPVPFSAKEQPSVDECVKHSDVVINLMGKYYETKHIVGSGRDRINYSFTDVHVNAAVAVAEACKKYGIERLIHVSALGASTDSPSEFLRSKAAGEAAVRKAFPAATIVRPGVMFGAEDRFLNLFANFLKLSMVNAVPLVEGGNAQIAPVYVDDVAGAIAAVVDNPELDGSTLELQGAEELTMSEMVKYVAHMTQTPAKIIDVPAAYLDMVGRVAEIFPTPWVTRDTLRLMSLDRVRSPDSTALSLTDLGIAPTPLDKSYFYLHRYRSGGHFNVSEGLSAY